MQVVSPGSTREKQCGDKNRFYRFDEAYQVALTVYLWKRDVIFPYRCPHCAYFHNGHPKPANKKKAENTLHASAKEVWAAQRELKKQMNRERNESARLRNIEKKAVRMEAQRRHQGLLLIHQLQKIIKRKREAIEDSK